MIKMCWGSTEVSFFGLMARCKILGRPSPNLKVTIRQIARESKSNPAYFDNSFWMKLNHNRQKKKEKEKEEKKEKEKEEKQEREKKGKGRKKGKRKRKKKRKKEKEEKKEERGRWVIMIEMNRLRNMVQDNVA